MAEFHKDEDSSCKNNNIRDMPITILVPNGKCSYSSQNSALTFISIVKTLLALALLGQSKSLSSHKELE